MDQPHIYDSLPDILCDVLGISEFGRILFLRQILFLDDYTAEYSSVNQHSSVDSKIDAGATSDRRTT